MKIIKGIISVVLITSLLASLFGGTSIRASEFNPEDIVSSVSHVEDGIEYTIHTYEIDGVRTVKVETSNSDDFFEIEFDAENEELVQTNYKSRGKNILGKSKYSKETIVMDTDEEEEVHSASYTSITYEKWKSKYWYSKKTNGTSYKIGCNLTYEIKASTSTNGAIKSYVESVDMVNHYIQKAHNSCAALGISYAVAFNLALVNIALPQTIIVSILMGVFGKATVASLTGLVKNYATSYSWYKKVDPRFETLKKLGVKV